ncbi:peptidoglycan-associated lipoprotein Pal [Rhizobacter sp. SG703]|uniref:peptidoglycan-associated lipoprotein Pal n=1 Tax=Rhizobacter sp. SG703 TaxID=2587140 RepID=UPI001445CEE8|nr:peptidoglycan-associated lipoprotein Pal [Rhizobacter sp. SG703]NKI93430.1 peptidoglycan-associated lipoprotein [Rhizobacter sp. SG703]
MKSTHLALLAALTSALLAGCASGVKLDDKPAPVENRSTGGTASNSGANNAGTSQSQVASVDLTKNAPAPASSVIYFDYDSYVVKDEFRPTIEAQAKSLSANKSKKVSVEGHTDERGGREYNLALGQKRAEAVVKSLELLGVSQSQVEAVSFGKERPAVQGSDEAAWAKNRRAEFNAK